MTCDFLLPCPHIQTAGPIDAVDLPQLLSPFPQLEQEVGASFPPGKRDGGCSLRLGSVNVRSRSLGDSASRRSLVEYMSHRELDILVVGEYRRPSNIEMVRIAKDFLFQGYTLFRQTNVRSDSREGNRTRDLGVVVLVRKELAKWIDPEDHTSWVASGRAVVITVPFSPCYPNLRCAVIGVYGYASPLQRSSEATRLFSEVSSLFSSSQEALALVIGDLNIQWQQGVI